MNPHPPWLPRDKHAAVCFSVDDVHPGKSTDAYEAGGDLGRGALRHVEWLLARHPKLRVTLFTTPDWREVSPEPSRPLLRRIPLLQDHFYLTDVLPEGTMALDRHPAFVEYLRRLARVEIAPHGLHHISRGTRVPVEFQRQNASECRSMLHRAIQIFKSAGLPFVAGMQPPGWNAPPALLEAMVALDFRFVAAARDIVTPIAPGATTNMSGMRGLSLIEPELICDGRLVQISSNFQATSPIERAFAIADAGGLVAIKAHIVKNAMGHIALDGMDEHYRDYLDTVFTELERMYGDALWWTSMGGIVDHIGAL